MVASIVMYCRIEVLRFLSDDKRLDERLCWTNAGTGCFVLDRLAM